jgi:ribosome-associated protein
MMDEPISKSQKKRDADKLKQMGVQFIALSEEKLATLPLTEPLYKAIKDAKAIKSHGAQKRQAQLIGKLMRSADSEAILEAYEHLLSDENAKTAHFHEAELWRSRLLEEDQDALTEFISSFGPEDIQKLRQLIKKATDDKLKQKNSGAALALFRYIRSCIE